MKSRFIKRLLLLSLFSLLAISNAWADEDDILTFLPVILSATNKASPPTVDFAGIWAIHEEASSLDPSCSGSANYDVNVTKIDNGNYSVDFGVKVVPGIIVDESLVVTYTGTYPEDGGTTSTDFSATFSYEINSGYTMTGHEEWSWTDGAYSCSGTSAYTGYKKTQ